MEQLHSGRQHVATKLNQHCIATSSVYSQWKFWAESWLWVYWPGILGSARTCLHAVMSAVCRGVDTRQGPSCVHSAPEFAELAYRLICVLCGDRETSASVLRYLRTHDFLYRHAQHLPFATRSSGTYLLTSLFIANPHCNFVCFPLSLVGSSSCFLCLPHVV